jgi:hypothetical protein
MRSTSNVRLAHGRGGFGELLHRFREVAGCNHDRQPEQEQRRGVPSSPGEPEAGRETGASFRLGGDEGRDGGEVIGIGRVPEPQQHGDDRREEERLSSAETRNPIVQSEQGTALRSDPM